MAIRKAVPDSDAVGGYRFEEFRFEPAPVVKGLELDADIDLLLTLTARTFLVPSFSLWLFLGPEGEGLFLRRAASRELLAAFRAEFAQRYPHIAARTERARACLDAVTVVRAKPATVPELIFSEAVRAVLPPNVQQAAQVPLPRPACSPHHNSSARCDHQLRYQNGTPGPIVWSEIAGMLDAAGRPLTEGGVEYLGKQPKRDRLYATAGLELAPMITAGTLCDPIARDACITRILTPFRT